MKKIWLLIFLVWIPLHGQKTQFGKIRPEEFQKDSKDPATMLYRSYRMEIVPDDQNGLVARIQVHERIRINNRDGFEYAEKHIPLYDSGTLREKITSLKAFTYNLQGGKIKKTKLDKKQIFYEKTDKYHYTVKFTMPQVDEGSIVEWSYKIVTPFLSLLDEIELQEYIPLQRLEVNLKIPEYTVYKFYQKGYLPIHFQETKNNKNVTLHIRPADFFKRVGLYENLPPRMSMPQTVTLEYEETEYSLTKTNVPPMRREPFSGNPDNFKSGVFPELKYFNFEGQIIPVALTWNQMAEKFYTQMEESKELKKRKYLKDSLQTLLASHPKDTLLTIFEWIKSHITWNGKYWGTVNVQKAFKNGTGNAYEVNFNLINMLRAAGIEAYPVFLSTESHGILLFPSWRLLNHVIAGVKKGDKYILLDATEKYAAPDVLPDDDLNFFGQAFLKEGKAEQVNLFPEKSALHHTSMQIRINSEGEIEGMQSLTLSRNIAMKERKKIEKSGDPSEFLRKKYPEIEIEKTRFIGLKKSHLPLREIFRFHTDQYLEEVGNKLYISPFLNAAIDENPFTAPDRKTPVIFHYPRIYSKQIEIQIPDGYEVEYLPPPVNLESKEAGASYVYQAEQKNGIIIVKSAFVLNLPVVPALQYNALREIWNQVVQAETGKIVLRKKQ